MSRRVRSYQTDGTVYVLELSKEARSKSAGINFLYVTGVAVLHVLAGMLNASSSRTSWIVFPYLAVFLPLAYAYFGVFTYRQALRMSSSGYAEKRKSTGQTDTEHGKEKKRGLPGKMGDQPEAAADSGGTLRMSGTGYHEGLLRIQKSLLAVFVLIVLGTVLEVLYMIFYRETMAAGKETLYLLFHLIQIGIVIAYGRYYDRTFTNVTEEM